ncbi:Nucleosomal histone H3-Lys79 methylase [Marasmius sp. AFHP31]|nr:Nucleosomal histone H3-Lys79 methylase [Marasmius sp. AFHP31]
MTTTIARAPSTSSKARTTFESFGPASTATVKVTTKVIHPLSTAPGHGFRTMTSTSTKAPIQQRLSPALTPSRSSSVSASTSPFSSPLSSPPSSDVPGPGSELGPGVGTKKKKRKNTSISTYAEAQAGPSTSRDTTPALPRPVKKLRRDNGHGQTKSKKSSSKKRRDSWSSSRESSPENDDLVDPAPPPIYRSSRSRSTSSFASATVHTPRRWGCEENGDPGPSHVSPEVVVRRLMKSYKAYFHNPDDPMDTSFNPHPTDYPVVELEYPNSGACERYILLQPKDKDHYSPILDFEKSLYTIIEHYLTPAQQALFGTIPNEYLIDVSSPPPSPSPSPPRSRASGSSHKSSPSLSSLTSLSDEEDAPRPQTNYLRTLQRAINRQDGPLFMKTVEQINTLLRSLKYPKLPDDPFAEPARNSLKAHIETWTDKGLPHKVLMRILEENYQRCVGPNVQSLRRYEAFTSAVYGELTPSLVHEIVSLTKLTEESLFLDLGSGVGNVVVQASLQTGCRSFGVELMDAPAKVASEMVEQFQLRCRMWGVRCGEMEVEQGNMLKSARVNDLIKQADVVLVDNKVFEESLNEALKPKFLDLKEGAIVVSLAPFAPVNARVTERNLDDITSAIFEVTERPYYPGAVSWGNGGGHYYIHRVDRDGYAAVRERFESSRASSRRANRSRW